MEKATEIKLESKQNIEPLWTKNYKIITIGSFISMIGNAIVGFAMGLLILDYTESTFLYALFMVLYNAPQVIVPTLAGPFIDKYSRKKTIYTLDFISTVAYGIFAALIFTNRLGYVLLILAAFFLGCVNSIYQVAFDSFYPMLISKGNFSKAYSIQSTLESVTQFMVPVSAILYNLVGIGPLFLINMVSFFVAAVMETRIQAKEAYVKASDENFGIQQYKKTFLEGISYLRGEKGLRAITLYFMITLFASASFQTLMLPYFKQNYVHGEYMFIFVMGCNVIGRFIGGTIHFKLHIKPEYRYKIALFVYVVITFLDGTILYFQEPVMMAMCLIEGLLGVTSYNIRISATQSYVPDGSKGRFNGIFQMATVFGMLMGQLLSGAMGELLPIPYVVSGFMFINLLGIYFIVIRNKNEISKIYNRIS